MIPRVPCEYKFVDNITLVASGNSLDIEHEHFKGRSKHVHLRCCCVCDYIDTGVRPRQHDQVVDIGSKACPAPQLKFQLSLLRGGL